jgi:predicted exporter
MNSRCPYRTLTVLLPSLFIGMLTSSTAFMLFVFSGMEGVRQLGFFAGCTLAVTMLIMLWLLPWCLRKKHKELELPLHRFTAHIKHPRITAAVFAAAALLAVALLPKLNIHNDVRQYDMSPESYDQEEQLISRIFQHDRSAGIALIEGGSADEALERSGVLEHPGIFKAAELFPAPSAAARNLEAWRKFDLDDYHKKLLSAAAKHSFPENYFDSFINMLKTVRSGTVEDIKTPALIGDIKQRLLVKGSNGKWHTVVMYDEKSGAEEYLSSFDYCTIISRERIPRVMAADIMTGILPAGCAAVIAVLLLTWLYFGSAVKALTAMLPVANALLFCAGFYALIGKNINIPVMAAGVILCGLAVDYGIFVIHAIAVGREKTVFQSVTISAITTMAGGLTVAFARHPMLHDAGITLMIGITAAWVSAIFLLPCLIGKRLEREN